MKKKSFIREIFIYLSILTGLLFVILCVFLVSSIGILENEILDSSDAFLKIYSNEFNNSISKMDELMKSISAQSVDLARIKSSNENERVLATISLHNYMKDTASVSDIADAIIVYDENYDICLDTVSSHVRFQQKKELREHARKVLHDEMVESAVWDFVLIDNNVYLYKTYKFNGRVIALYSQMKHLLTTLEAEDNGNRSIFLANKDGVIGRVWGVETPDIQEQYPISGIQKSNYYRTNQKVAGGQLNIYCYAGKDGFLQQTHTSMIIVGVAVFATVIFMIFILSYTKRKVIHPMKSMVYAMECIKEGDYEKRIEGQFHAKEFEILQTTTNQMIDEIVGLKIQTYEKRIELQDMQLKSIRLQLKPHFFLNALTTISSLSGQNKNAQIKTYIDALSRNVRYMFRAGFHTVSIKDEIRHVENYFEMQELKYPNCVFYLIDLPEELTEWKIPQMLIHTFVENEFKYAVAMDTILTILIKISKQQYQGTDMLLIEIEDDGKGYPAEVLEYMRGSKRKTNQKGTRIGLLSIKRMMELMYDRNDLLVIENTTPHGCLNKIYVPKQPKHELLEDIMENKI